jgi:asparagine synthase (glutamine-hydrolysing)
MCGIAGWVSAAGIDVPTLRRMTDVQAHRGPDDAGYLVDDGGALHELDAAGRAVRSTPRPAPLAGAAGLGHRRLAILDLSTAAHQPMADPERRYWLTYNGEIYNYVELRQALRAAGWRFRSDGDTEVVLAAYLVWGEACVERFNGMWAFAIWDARERRLFCARDRFGVKPFYYYKGGGHFIFASELKGLLAHPAVPRGLNDRAARDFLSSGTIDHRPGESLLAEVAELPSAHTLVLEGDNLRLREYWRIPAPERKEPFTPALTERCRELLQDAIAIRLRSDVPVGGTLSGGIDSATLTCLIDRSADRSYPVFTVQFPGHAHDESRYVRDVMAEARNLELHTLTPSSGELLRDLTRVLWHQDEPFADTSIFAHYRIMRLVRESGVKVVLTGQGADEIFAGYASYYRSYLGHLAATGRLRELNQEVAARSAMTGESRVGLFQAALYHASPLRTRNALHALATRRAVPWLRPEPGASPPRFAPAPPGWSGFDWYLYEALRRWAIPHLLRQDDRNSMAFGLESRAPFMDYRLVELLFRTADDAKVGGGESKRLLRAVGEGVIPASITARRDKIGFYTPMTEWLRDGRPLVEEVLGGGFATSNPYFDAAPLRRAADRLFAGDARHASAIWWAFSFTLWYETVIAGSAAAPAAAPPVALQEVPCAS